MGPDEPLYPVNLRLRGQRCLVVGGGAVARQKITGLLDAGARVEVIAPEVLDEILALDVVVHRRPYAPGDVADYRLAITATDDAATNRTVYLDGEAHGVWVNSADDPDNCAFILPARVRRGPLLVTIGTGGVSPALASWLRRRFEEELGPEYERLIELLSEARERLRAEGRSTELSGWQTALDSGMLELVRQGRISEAKETLDACLSSSSV